MGAQGGSCPGITYLEGLAALVLQLGHLLCHPGGDVGDGHLDDVLQEQGEVLQGDTRAWVSVPTGTGITSQNTPCKGWGSGRPYNNTLGVFWALVLCLGVQRRI